MPHIDINMLAGRDDETKKRVADAVIDTMMKELGCAREHLSVAVHDFDISEWDEKIADKVDESKLFSGPVFRTK